MAAKWAGFCRHRDFAVSGDQVTVTIGDRTQRITVTDEEDAFSLRSVVIRKRLVEAIDGLPLAIWQRNRDTDLVGFRIDRKYQLVAEAWVPKAGVTTSEFQLYLRAVAEESDRLEYQLTGTDLE